MKRNRFLLIFRMLVIILMAGSILASCNKDDNGSAPVVLNSFGPSPALRGTEIRFIGQNLNKVTAVVLPQNIEITEFSMFSSDEIRLVVPQEAEPGYVVLKTPQGDITTKTQLGYSEPISIESFAPDSVKAGDTLTIKGDYLAQIKQVIFANNVPVDSAAFKSLSRYEIKVLVPIEAQTGKVAVSNGAESPIVVYTESDLKVTLPEFTGMTPNPAKPGTAITISGKNFNLVKSIIFNENLTVTNFTTDAAKTTITVDVPANAKDGAVKLVAFSGVEVASPAELTLVMPAITKIDPNPVKNGATLTITGTDLDLVTSVTFGGDKTGTVTSATETELQVTVPDDAITGVVTLATQSGNNVTSEQLTLIDPVFTSFTPTQAKANTDITITGTDLDLVTTVNFTGGISGTIASQSETSLMVTVPVGAQTGPITLVAKNGTEVTSTTDFTILTNLPVFSSYTEAKATPGQILTINGTNMDLIKELIFPDNVVATAYGIKTDTKVEVYVPLDAAVGYGQIKMITYEGEEGLLPEIFIGGVDPVVDPSLIINDFDETGHDLSWDNWGGNVELGSDPAIAISGNYMHGIANALTGWAWIWGCNHSALPKVEATKADYLLKMDVNLNKPFGTTNVHFQMEMAGNRIDLGGFGVVAANETTPGWITITYDLSQFADLPDVISGDDTLEWGMNFWYADGSVDITGLYIDNIRFEHK